MIPENKLLEGELEIGIYPAKTYLLDCENKRIRGFVDGIDAMVQAIYHHLNTERFDYSIYSRNYGVELLELIGEPMSYVLPEIKRRVTEALTWDTRINSVDNFEFTVEHGNVHCKFVVHTIFGDVEEEKAVTI